MKLSGGSSSKHSKPPAPKPERTPKQRAPKAEKPQKTGFKPGQAGVSAEKLLAKYFSGKVTVKAKEKGGEVILKYRDEDQLLSFLNVLKEHNLQ